MKTRPNLKENASGYKLVNYAEGWVWDALADIQQQRPDICFCDKCRYDMAAYALNKIPPSYALSDIGNVHTKIKIMESQYRMDLLMVVVNAVDKISQSPRH
jgi:competence protein ComFB